MEGWPGRRGEGKYLNEDLSSGEGACPFDLEKIQTSLKTEAKGKTKHGILETLHQVLEHRIMIKTQGCHL